MRSWLLVGSLVALLAVTAVACSDKKDDEPSPTATSPAATATKPATTASTAVPTSSGTPASIGGTSTPVKPTAVGTPSAFTVTPFPQRRADGQTQRDACGAYTVVREDTLGAQGAPTASSVTVVNASGAEVFKAETAQAGSSLGVDWCYDINDDGAPELSVFSYSGGAHCCIEQQVVTLLPTGSKAILTYPSGNAGPLQPKDLDGKKPLELTGMDDRFAYFQGLPYAVSPFVGVVYAEVGGEWVDVTAEPIAKPVLTQYRQQLVTQVAQCSTVQADLVEVCQKGLMTAVMVESLVLGDWESFQFTVSVPDAVRTWLNGVRPNAEALIKQPKS